MTGSANEVYGVERNVHVASRRRGRGSLREKGGGRDFAGYHAGGFRNLKDALTKTATFEKLADRKANPFLRSFEITFLLILHSKFKALLEALLKPGPLLEVLFL